jgi:alpha-L-rhamnosidase
VRVTDELNVVKEFNSPSGKRLLDFGQNLVGRLKITVEGEEGTVITLRHAEVLENGQLGVRPLRTAKATDTYTLRGGGAENWAPRFTFHGFRFAEITTSHPLKSEPTVVAQVIHSDMRRTGWFESSNELLNRFHENVVWGMRGNFLYLPTDCPQRDERMGWTGDIQVFAPTASFLYKADAFLGSWLQDLAIEQVKTGDGSVPFVIPAVTWDVMNARSAWGDAATVVPTVVHERFGDIDVLRAQLGSMKAWADHLNELAGSRRLWEGSLQFADWLDPTAPPNDPAKAQTDQDLVSSAYFYLSTKLVAKAARVLGEQKLADAYDGRAMEIKAAFLAEYVTASGRMMSDAQTAYALGIQFGLFANEDQRQRMGDRLAELVRRDGYTIATGFVGTPLITDALSATGHIAVVDRLLFQTKCPSWLYPVTMGATTIWERWDSMLPDGTINPGQMTSFNHYALGGIADWLHRRVAGIAPAEPGYRKIRIDPLPLPSLDHAKAILDSPYGLIESQWYREGGSVTIEVMIPANTEAEVFLPGSTTPKEVGSGSHNWTVESSVDTVRPSMDMTLAELADHPEVLESVAAAIASIRPKYGLRFLKRTPWTKRRTLANALKAFPREISEVVRAALTS